MDEKALPTRSESLWFHFRAFCLRVKRSVTEWRGAAPAKLRRRALDPDASSIVESRTVLFNSASPAEFALQAGKVQNLRIAARELNGIVISPGQLFSFWKNLGRASRRRGFVEGRELREGCVIPNVGGGLCQLSNAIYDVALQSGCEIVERHAHTQRVPGSTTQPGRDATIFWNYVDLRFRPRFGCQLRVELSRGELVVGLVALQDQGKPPIKSSPEIPSCEMRSEAAETCETCAVTKCFRNPSATSLSRRGITAWVLDKFEPEFDRWMDQHHGEQDAVIVPLNSRRIESYRWATDRFGAVAQARVVTWKRSFGCRRLAAQGAERQRALLKFDRALAEALAKSIPHIADHLVVSQNLLPHLWRHGDLSGRTFDVLMTRLPILDLERTLDAAAQAHPESKTLSDFRAPAELSEAESEALSAARFLITPHSQIAEADPARTVKLDWQLPKEMPRTARGDRIVFPASTLARKGCYEMRELTRALNIRLQLAGPILETPDFWNNTDFVTAEGDWIENAALVVLPAWVEHWPRRLLRAAAAGVPVIATSGCGLGGVPNVTEIPMDDAEALHFAVKKTLECIDS